MADGKPLRENPDFDVSDRDYFKEIMSRRSDWDLGSRWLQDAGRARDRDGLSVKADDGSVPALVAMQVRLDALSALMDEVKLGATGYGWLATGGGLVIAHPNAAEVMSSACPRPTPRASAAFRP